MSDDRSTSLAGELVPAHGIAYFGPDGDNAGGTPGYPDVYRATCLCGWTLAGNGLSMILAMSDHGATAPEAALPAHVITLWLPESRNPLDHHGATCLCGWTAGNGPAATVICVIAQHRADIGRTDEQPPPPGVPAGEPLVSKEPANSAPMGELLAGASAAPASGTAAELLAREVRAVSAELSKADGKCGTLTALTGTAAVVAAAQVPHGPALAQVALGLSAAVLAAATMLTLSALRPRLGTAGWCRWSLLTVDGIRGAADAGDADQADVLASLSRIARAKYFTIRRAIDLTALGLALLVIGLALGAIA